ncbi:MAG: cysteine desulfurase [Chloroflexi bacterium]|nr:cysteine desulfurase [Chloroflexota bacterium]
MDRAIYLDYSATTPVDSRVVEAMLPYYTEKYGNSSSIHRFGQRALQALEGARERIAKILYCHPKEIIFTSGGSESDNLALRGVAFASRQRGRHIITSAVEHEAVLKTARQLQSEFGFSLTEVPVDRFGRVDPASIQQAIIPETILITIMAGNNEVGTLQPVREIAEIARRHGVPFHSDAVQLPGHGDLNVSEMGVDMLSLSGHKFYAPKGMGILYVKRGTPLVNLLTGGSQEGGRRAGTENVAGAVALATALELVQQDLDQEAKRLRHLRDRLLQEIPARVPGAEITGHPTERLAHHASFLIPDVEPESLILGLDFAGIAASSASACHAAAQEPSHVLAAMGVAAERALGSLRLSLGRWTTDDEVDYVLNTLPGIVSRLQSLNQAAV